VNSNIGPISHRLATIHPLQTRRRQTDDNSYHNKLGRLKCMHEVSINVAIVSPHKYARLEAMLEERSGRPPLPCHPGYAIATWSPQACRGALWGRQRRLRLSSRRVGRQVDDVRSASPTGNALIFSTDSGPAAPRVTTRPYCAAGRQQQ